MGQFTKMYQTKTWHQLRARQLRLFPLCRMCEEQGDLVPAAVVDHVIPHKGNMDLFIDANNLQSLCVTHHNKHKQLQEIHGYNPGVGEDGLPLDMNHPFRRAWGSGS